jgi:ketosteroid isomerase-like protein
MSTIAIEAGLADQVYTAFLRGDDSATEKVAELNNVRVVKATYDAFLQGDVEALLAAMDDDIDWHIVGPASIPFAGQRRGKSEVRLALQKAYATVKNQQPEVHDVIAQGDTITVIGHERGQCTANDNNYHSFWVHVFTINEGKISRFREYLDTAALADAFTGTKH